MRLQISKSRGINHEFPSPFGSATLNTWTRSTICIFRSANPVIVWQLMESCCTSIMVFEVEEALHPPIMTPTPATRETNQTWWGQRRRFRLARVTLQVTLNGRVLIFANLDTKSIQRLFVPRIGAWAIQYQSRPILPQMSFEVALPNRGGCR